MVTLYPLSGFLFAPGKQPNRASRFVMLWQGGPAPSQIKLSDAWGKGVFGFLSDDAAKQAGQGGAAGWAKIETILKSVPNGRCFWIGNPSAVVPPILTDASGILSSETIFQITPHLGVGLRAGTRLSIDPQGQGLLVSANGVNQGVALRPAPIGGSGGNWVVPGDGSIHLYVGPNGTADSTGEVRFTAPATDALLADLNLDLRYPRATKGAFPHQPQAAATPFPIFAIGDVKAIIIAALDPLGDRTNPPTLGRFKISHIDGQTPLPTHYHTSHGHAVHFLPHPEATLEFSHTVLSLDPTTGEALNQAISLVPSGPHEIHVPTDPGGDHRLMAGNRGTELFPFTARGDATPGDIFDFASGNPAFDNLSLQAVNISPHPHDPGETLTPVSQTAWAAIRPYNGDKVGFVSQSQEAPLRKPATENLLEFAELAWTVPATAHVPLVPMAANANNAMLYSKAVSLECDVIAPHRLSVMRKSRIGADAVLAAVPKTITTTTPQGFLVDVDPATNNWQTVTIALSQDGATLTLKRPDGAAQWAVQDALQRRSVFLVATQPPESPDLPIGNADLSTTLLNWRFTFELPGWPASNPTNAAQGNNAPTLIIKFSERPIAADGAPDPKLPPLASDWNSWTMPENFNRDKTTATSQVGSQIADILKHAADSSNPDRATAFNNIKSRLVNPNWNGVMLLGADITTPDELAAIQVGFPSDYHLQATCIGIDANKIKVAAPTKPANNNPPQISLEHSAFFAVISYPSDSNVPDPPPWGALDSSCGITFQVTNLLLSIENSAVFSFACDARLRLPSFLGGVAGTEGDPADTGKGLINLKGKYERRPDQGQGTFLLSGNTDIPAIDFQANSDGGIIPAVKSLQVSRIQLTSSLSGTTGQIKTFTCAFSFAGAIDFDPFPPGVSAISITGLAFDSATVRLTFDNNNNTIQNTRFAVDMGPLRLNMDTAKLNSGLLAQLPFRLSALHFSGFQPNGGPANFLKIPDLGMVNLTFPGAPFVDHFDFGLEFSLDLGAFGGLVSAARKLSASIVIGWPDFRRPGLAGPPQLSIGFRLDGGGGALDLGIEGILKISAESAEVKSLKQGLAIVLNKCQIDVLGYVIPGTDGDLDLAIFLPTGAMDRPAWFALLPGDVAIGTVDIFLIALAQRLKLFASGLPSSAADAIKQIQALGQIKDPADLFGKQVTYDADGGWSLAVSAAMKNAVGIDIVLADPVPLYGIKVSVPPDGSLFSIDVLYTRIADDIGVFSIDIAPPSTFRHIFIGAVEIDIGNLGLQIFSDGSWTFDLGFPRGLDFTRSFVAQIGPFIGFGGMYIASRDAKTTTLLAGKNCVRVLEAGIAVRVGLGREIQEGPFSAGASITIFGILQGAFGIQATGNRQVHLIGQVGAIAEIYGFVDFVIIRAGVSVRVYAEITLDIESGEPITLAIDAGVSVRVTVVIAHIHCWLVDITISVSFSFDTNIHLQWTLQGAGLAALDGQPPPIPLDWTPVPVFTTKHPLNFTIALDESARFTSAGNAETVLIVLLSATDSDTGVPALTDLLEALLRWTLLNWLNANHQPLPAPNTPDNAIPVPDSTLKNIWNDVSGFKSLARTGTNPLNMQAIIAFLQQNFDITVNVPGDPNGAAPTSKTGVIVPIIPDIAVTLAPPSGTSTTIDFGDIHGAGATVCDDAYEKKLDSWFSDHAAQISDPDQAPRLADADAPRTAATVIFEDWVGHLVKQIFAYALKVPDQVRAVNSAQKDVTLADLVSSLRDQTPHLTGLAARILTYGLRVPTSATNNATKALYELTQQQFPGVPADIGADTKYPITFAPARGATWFTLQGPARAQPIDVTAARDLATRVAALLPPVVSVSQDSPVQFVPFVSTVTGQTSATITGTASTLWTLPPNLLAHLGSISDPAVPVELSIPPKDGDPETQSTPVSGTVQWATTVEFGLRQVFSTDANTGTRTLVSGIYQVVGANRANYQIIQDLIALTSGAPAQKIAGLLINRAGSPAIEALQAGNAVIIKTNFSTVPMPNTELAALPPNQPASADIMTNVQEFLQLLKQCSIVNSPGFWLRYSSAAGNLDELFTAAAGATGAVVASISLVVIHKDLPQGALSTPVNTLISQPIPQVPGAQPRLRVKLTTIPAVHTAFEPGNVAIRAERNNPDPNNQSPDPATKVATRYSLMVYSTPGTDPFDASDPETCVPSSPNTDNPAAPPTPPQPPTPAPQKEPQARIWYYRTMIPFWRLASANQGKADGDMDPYIGVGRQDLSVTLSWRDFYGNNWIGGDKQVPNLYLKYPDPLRALSEWPKMTFGWVPGPTKNTARVTITFEGMAAVPNKNFQWIETFYRRLYHQLNQPDVAVTLTAGVAPPLSLKKDDKRLLKLIDGIRKQPDGGYAALTPLVFDVPVVFRHDGASNPVAAAIKITIERTNKSFIATGSDGRSAADVDPRYAVVTTDIPPDLSPYDPSKGETPESPGNIKAWTGFAAAFEQAYPGLRFLKQLDSSGTTAAGSGNAQAYCAPLALLAPQPGTNAQPITYAPIPLSTKLMSGTAHLPVGDLDPGTPAPLDRPTQKVADIDIDSVAARSLAAIEQALSPAGSVNLWRVDAGSFNAIADAKQSIAKSLSKRLKVVIKDQRTDPDPFLETAQKAFRNRVRTDLSAAYGVGAVVVMPSDAYGNDATNPPPYLLGTPNIDKATGIKILPAKVGRAPAASSLTFLIEWDPRTVGSTGQSNTVPSAPGNLSFAPNFVEIPDQPNPTGDEYIPSTWYQPLTKVDPASYGAVNIPLPLRQAPTRPTLLRQSYVDVGDFATNRNDPRPQSTSLADRARGTRLWHYAADITHDMDVGRDQLLIQVDYKVVDTARLADAPQRTLFDSLISFDAIWPKLGVRISSLAAATQTDDVSGYKTDVRQFAWLCADLAQTLADYPVAIAELAAAPPTTTDTGTVIKDVDGSLEATLTTASPIAHELIAFVPGQDKWAVFTPPKPATSRGGTVKATPIGTPSTTSPQSMRIILSHLDILTQQTGTSSFQIVRNATLIDAKGKRQIDDDFIYQTAIASFPSAYVPNVIDSDRLDLDDPPAAQKKELAEYLFAFINPLLANAASDVIISIAASLAVPIGSVADTNKPFGPEWSIYPLESIPPVQLSDQGSAITDFVTAIVKNLSDHKPLIQPSPPRSEVRFTITVFGGTPLKPVPLLTLTDVFVTIDAFNLR